MNSKQCMNSKVKILAKRVYSANLRNVAVLERLQSRFELFIYLPASWREKIIDKCIENKSATERFLAHLHLSNLVNTIFYLQSSLCCLFSKESICRQIFIQTYKHSKFGADMLIYPKCNAWRHLFAYRGLPRIIHICPYNPPPPQHCNGTFQYLLHDVKV